MKLGWLILFQIAGLTAFAVEDAVEMNTVRASVSYIYFHIEYVSGTDKIAEISVTWVALGSGAEKAGLREGDRLITVDGAPVAGRKRSDLVNKSGGVAVRGREVTFAGRRGFFRKSWLITASIDPQGHMALKEKAKEPNK